MTRDQINRYQRESIMRALAGLPPLERKENFFDRLMKDNDKRRKTRTGVAA
ncbi:hypothetical protein NLZ15_17425 [Atlantibacter subterranea]|uniref:hypothetical protein n=1 Tax=Atlantibacter subterraneus TaxID=255519 RepID=UPI0020C259C4|nr:hypothetical protein [Atlantibacter subterranea]UTJ46604.1 hypothetical protein NLZ15_17425 [Atlantibacter subterranea]